MRRRPNFSVAVIVVVLLIVLTFGANLIRPLIPPPPPNPIANYSGDFLKQAAPQTVEWHPIDASAFSEARRLDRPVLLFIGVAWSQTGRELDQDVLTTSDVQNYLLHNFICVRIDGSEAPAWVSAYLPVSRVSIGIRPRFQIWALEPDGKLIGNINRRLPSSRLGQNNFLNELVRIREAYTELRQQGATGVVETQQLADVAQLKSANPNATVDFAGMAQTVRGAGDSRNGGFPLNEFQDLRPYAWEYLLQTGQNQALHDTLMPTLRSRAVDVLDGGFFSTGRNLDRSLMEFDKSATTNAEMAWLLSQARPLLQDKGDKALCDYVLNSTVASLTGEFRADSGFISTARIGDEEDNGRSARTSITPQRLREALDPDNREWARTHLGLRIESNPQMVPYLAGASALDKVELARARFFVGAAKPTFTTDVFMDVNGTVAARLMETGRAIGNTALINVGSDLFSRMDTQRVGDTVPHDLEMAGRSDATLQDYLAYADAALQDYLSSGRVPSLTNGLAVLRRGLSIFRGDIPGEFHVGQLPSEDLMPAVVATTQIVDDLGESSSAKVVRLCTSYGRLMIGPGNENDEGLALLRMADATEGMLAQPVSTLGISAVSFAVASLSLVEDEYAIAVGPDAQRLADELYALRPTRFVAAAFGPVRTDLANKKPGIYVLNQGALSGPYSTAEAASRLPIALTLAQ